MQPEPGQALAHAASCYDLASRAGAFNERVFELGEASDKAYWYAKYAEARAFMKERANIPRTLIEVAAQHPLIDGETPGEEFRKRLLLGKELLEEELGDDREAQIYVPGSRHVYEGTADNVSLSKAGTDFLIAVGLDKELIHGDDLNLRYKKEQGVYGSADECFVASSYFKDGNFGRLCSVLSPVQMFRKTLHYIEFGVLPLNYTAPTADTFHNWIDEIFSAVPRVALSDPDLQDPKSAWAVALRATRMPKVM